MRNAAATGTAARAGMPFIPEYTHAAKPRITHNATNKAQTLTMALEENPVPARWRRPGEFGIAVMIALAFLRPVCAAEPPADMVKRVAHRESETAEERRHYAYTQSVRLQELDGRGRQTGEYKEVREVIFSPTGERTERFVTEPVSLLKNLVMTPEDFADIREIQPFIITEDRLRLYDVQYKGEEQADGFDCWVLAIRPRQILSGQRLFDGMAWVKQDDFSVIRSEGKAVPQIVTGKQENLFPRFTTARKLINGFWFPSITSADDTLYFRSAPVREKLTIRYENYKKFGSESTITFDK